MKGPITASAWAVIESLLSEHFPIDWARSGLTTKVHDGKIFEDVSSIPNRQLRDEF